MTAFDAAVTSPVSERMAVSPSMVSSACAVVRATPTDKGANVPNCAQPSLDISVCMVAPLVMVMSLSA